MGRKASVGGMDTEERYLRDAILGCSYYEAGSRWKEKRQGSSTHPGGGTLPCFVG